MRKQWWGNNLSTLSLKQHSGHFWYLGKKMRHCLRADWKTHESWPFSLVVKSNSWWSSLPPVRLLNAQLWCALEQAVFFYAVFWHSTLFLCTLVSHPTTIPDIQRLAVCEYFYWKMRNLCKLLFSFFLFLSFFFFLRDRGCKLFEISQKPNSSFACVFEMAP